MQREDVFCGQCGATNSYGMQYCRKCGAVLVYTLQGQYPAPGHQPGAPATPPLSPQIPPPDEPAGWSRWLPWLLVGMFAGLGCLVVTGLALYLLDPFAMFTGTPTPTITLTGTPAPTITALPSYTPEPTYTFQPTDTPQLPTSTAYPTYTAYPTFTQPASPPTASPTATADPFEFIDAGVSAPLVRYGGCAPSSVEFWVEVSSSKNVTAIVLFTRLKNTASQEYLTGWTSGVSMKYDTNSIYRISQSGDTLAQGTDLGTTTVVYQFVNQTKQDEYIRSQNYQDLALEKCP